MRPAYLIATLLVSSVALADSPPSKTLERAIKLYDKKDFYSASIELRKVIDGETGDDEANVHRAEFFEGKTMYQMGYYGSSMAAFDRIVNNPKQNYINASAKWVTALLRINGLEGHVGALEALDPKVIDDESLASVRDELKYDFGAMFLRRGDYKKALALLTRVDEASEFSGQAHAAAAIAYALSNDDKSALTEATAAMGKSPKDGPHNAAAAEQGGVIAGWIQLRAKKWDDAATAFDKAPKGASGIALWGAAVAKAGKKGTSFTGIDNLVLSPPVSGLGLEPSLLPSALAFDGCGKADALATLKKEAPAMKKELATLLAGSDDNAEMFEKHATDLGGGTAKGLSARTRALTKAMLGGSPSLQNTLAFVVELNTELTALQHADKAWQTTQVAANILSEITVEQSVAAADAGKILRQRTQLLIDGLDAIAASKVDGLVLPCGK